MIRIVIVDDEALVLDFMRNILTPLTGVEIVGSFLEPEKALEEIPKLNPDLIFLDVEMPDMNGIELGTLLMDQQDQYQIVFITAYDSYAIEAFKVSAIHYLLKPPSQKDLLEVIKRVEKSSKRVAEYPTGQISINVFGEMYIEKNNNPEYIKFPTSKAKELLALLLLYKKSGVSRWKILEKLWSDITEKKAKQYLYTTVYRLRKALLKSGIEATIVNKLGVYYIRFDNAVVSLYEVDDCIRKKEPVNASTISDYEKILRLYKGRLFGDEDYLWCVLEREFYKNFISKSAQHLKAYYKENEQKAKLKALEKRMKRLDL